MTPTSTSEKTIAAMNKDAEHYVRLKHPMEIVEDEDGRFVASIPDLPGCVSYGDTLDEAVKNLKDVKRLWISGALESGQQVPEPTSEDDFSGKFVLRIPRGLHRSLDKEAKKQGVSLNQYITHLLSERNTAKTIEHMFERISERMAEYSFGLPQRITVNSTDVQKWVHAAFTKNVQCRIVGQLSGFQSASGKQHPQWSGPLELLDHVQKPPKAYTKIVKRPKLEGECAKA